MIAMQESSVEHERARAAALARAVAPVAVQLSTPALVIDLDAVEHNVAAMVRRVGHPSRWRPHVKTVKQPTIVGLLLDAGVHRFKAATPAEVALVLEAAAARALPAAVDVLLAYPAAPPQVQTMLALRRAHPRARLGLLADSPSHAAELARFIEQSLRPPADHQGPLRTASPAAEEDLPAFDLWLDVDVGMHRTGSAAAVWREADIATSPWLVPVGLHGYEGHLGWSERDAAFAGYDALCELASALPFTLEQVCTSGTHGYAHALAHQRLRAGSWSHQVSPGTLVLSDRRSTAAAADLGLRQAAFVCSRVVALPGDDRITLDAGSKALAPDCPAPACAVLGEPAWVPLTASEEHRPVRIDQGPRPARGSLVWLVPDHVCTTVNLHAEALYVRTDVVVGSAPVLARGHRPWLTLAALLLALAGPGAACQPITTGVDVQLLLPQDDPELQRTNNVSVVLEPQGFSRTVASDGLDFGLSFEVPPDGVTRTLSVYLAEDDELLAWGRTPRFTYAGATGGLSLLLARPGALVPLDFEFTQPDAAARVAPVGDVGMLVLASDGGALFLDAYQYTLEAASSLEEGPATDDGVLVGAADGGVVRVAWNAGVAAWRFDAVTDAWQTLELGGDRQARPGAAVWIDPEGESVRIFGGGDADDVVELALRGTEARDLTTVDGLRLDGPRAGATVIELDGHPIVVGGDDPTLPVAWRADREQAAGPTTAWTALACAPLAASPPQALCMGGLRDGMPTADALRLELLDGSLQAEDLASFLPLPLPAPLLLPDETALYAQGEGRWLRIDRADLLVTEQPNPAPRATGGSLAPLPSGATLLVGGLGVEGTPLDRWYAFAPTVEP
jgi:D-serine deaminase-like pyridoxal phosphate-dependent protein